MALWHGDATVSARQRILREPPDILLTTPESLEAMLIRLCKCARRPTVELYAAGYLLRRVSDGGKPGRTKHQYRLNPDAEPQARALLDA